jgi:nitrite reductase/ring-hydroxylating ferredoxin subunit
MPVPGSVLCRLDSIDDGACKELRLGIDPDSLSLLLHRKGTSVSAYVNCCPHFSLPLNARLNNFLLLTGEQIMCAWHCAVFQLSDGRCTAGPAHGMSLEQIPVTVQAEEVYFANE